MMLEIDNLGFNINLVIVWKCISGLCCFIYEKDSEFNFKIVKLVF